MFVNFIDGLFDRYKNLSDGEQNIIKISNFKNGIFANESREKNMFYLTIGYDTDDDISPFIKFARLAIDSDIEDENSAYNSLFDFLTWLDKKVETCKKTVQVKMNQCFAEGTANEIFNISLPHRCCTIYESILENIILLNSDNYTDDVLEINDTSIKHAIGQTIIEAIIIGGNFEDENV